MRSTGSAVEATDGRVRSTGTSVDATGGSVRSTGPCLNATDGPVNSTGTSVDATDGPVNSTGTSVDATGAAVSSTGAAVDAADNLVSSTAPRSTATDGLVNSTDFSVDATDGHVSSTSPPSSHPHGTSAYAGSWDQRAGRGVERKSWCLGGRGAARDRVGDTAGRRASRPRDATASRSLLAEHPIMKDGRTVLTYAFWCAVVRQSGPAGLRAFKSFHDEKLSGKLAGVRSSRLSQQWRVLYRVRANVVTVYVERLTPHDYRA